MNKQWLEIAFWVLIVVQLIFAYLAIKEVHEHNQKLQYIVENCPHMLEQPLINISSLINVTKK
jgi:hypothetical protein